MRIVELLCVALLPACDKVFLEPPAQPSHDCTWDPASSYFDPCELPQPRRSALVIAGDHTYDADAGILVPTADPTKVIAHESAIVGGLDGPRVLSIESLSIESNATLRLLGDRPVVIAVWGDAAIAGRIDVGRGGAGRDSGKCMAGAGGANVAGGGGGGGGGFASAGGAGGTGRLGTMTQGGAAGGALPPPVTMRGGCRGGAGGAGNNGAAKGALSGGGVAIVALGALSITGRIEAGGAGGDAGLEASGGGAGGGSGGLIALEAISIDHRGVLAANGGGGGGGAATLQPGRPGTDATADTVPAPGGGAAGGGRPGGAGATDVPATDGTSDTGASDDGAGGGGGGAGYILVWSPISGTGIASPSVRPMP